MDQYRRSGQMPASVIRYLALSAILTFIGCASPGPPQSPSLKLPQPVHNLTATRVGDTVELRFTPPANSTDKLALRAPTLSGQLCRQLPHEPCLPVGPRTSVATPNSKDMHDLATWTDTLPASLTQNPPQLLAYRVEFFNSADRSAGPSNQAFTASGPAPSPVQNLRAEGSREGIVLQWTPAPDEVILRRENLRPTAHTPITQWLQTNDSKGSQASTLDPSALPDTPYSYIAQRRTTLRLATHSIELRSFLSNPVSFTLQRIYPPPAPVGLTAAGYSAGTPPTFAVDLIWQPITETGLITPLAGYNLYREQFTIAGEPTGPGTRLNSTPISLPSFHDPTANPASAYRYSVTAVDAKGNQSPPATVTLQPSATP